MATRVGGRADPTLGGRDDRGGVDDAAGRVTVGYARWLSALGAAGHRECGEPEGLLGLVKLIPAVPAGVLAIEKHVVGAAQHPGDFRSVWIMSEELIPYCSQGRVVRGHQGVEQ